MVSDVVNEHIVNLRVELDSQGLDAGPETIKWHLHQHHNIDVSISTIRRRLLAAGLIEPQPKKRPKRSYIRFEAELPNEMWQSDFTHQRLTTGADTEIITWLDDHSRYCLHSTAHQRVSGLIVVETFTKTAEQHGFPASVLTDNGMVYTTRFSGGRGGRNQLETLLVDLDIEQKHTRPNHPTTTGKVERFQQTLKKWLRAHSADTINELQTHIDNFVEHYNNHRPHSSLKRRTPAVVYNLLPKAGPAGTNTGTHHRLRHDRVDKIGCVTLRHNSRLHHIGIGRAHAHTPILMLIDDLDIRVINTTTGELLRHLTLNPKRGYQPRFKT